MTDRTRVERVDELLDRNAIVAVTRRMAECLDQLDWTGLEACFLEELTVRYGYVLGDRLTAMPAAAFVDAWHEATAGLEATQHLLANHRVDVRGDEATCTAYCLVQHYYPEPSGGCTWTLGGHYDFGFVRTDDGWRIGRLELADVWATGNRHLLERAAREAGGRAGRDPRRRQSD